MQRRDSVLLLFAKFPSAGRVKTRLEPALGREKTAEFARISLIECLRYFSAILDQRISIDSTFNQLIWFVAPHSCLAEAQTLLLKEGLHTFWQVRSQSNTATDLGERLFHAVQTAHDDDRRRTPSEYRSTVLIGSDCLHLTHAHLIRASQNVSQESSFLIPAQDGGYVLFAVPSTCPQQLFQTIRWSSSYTLQDQLERARVSHMVAKLDQNTMYDIDDAASLALLKQDRLQPHVCTTYPKTLAVLQEYFSAVK